MTRRRAKHLSWHIPLHCIRIWAKNAVEGDSVYWCYRDDVKPLTQTRYLHQFAAQHDFRVRDTLCYGAGAVGMGVPDLARCGSRQHYPHDVPDIQSPWHHGAPDPVAHVVAVVSGYDWGPDVRGRQIGRMGVERRRQVVRFRLIMQA